LIAFSTPRDAPRSAERSRPPRIVAYQRGG
jgi:hypothetical protein